MEENIDFFPETKAPDILEKNLNNVKSENTLWQTRDKLSMKDRIGFLPISIWQPDWMITNALKKIVGDNAETRGNSSYGFQKNQSIFNPHLAQMILSAYCPKNALIYDPFAGGGTRGFIATAMGHRYFGVELRQEEVDRIIHQQTKLGKVFVIKQGDSKDKHFDTQFDFCYTCPPYYDLEIYSKLENDLSNAPSYNQFLCGMLNCVRTTYSLMRTGTLSVFVVGNFRDKNGDLIHFNGDLIQIAKTVGFKLHDELIFWGASKCASQRCGQFEANRKSVRVHEYIIILKK